MRMLKQVLLGTAAAVVFVGCSTTTAVCPVSGEGLNSMGGPFVVDHKGQKIKLCCEGCKEDFDKDPKRYLAAPKPEK